MKAIGKVVQILMFLILMAFVFAIALCVSGEGISEVGVGGVREGASADDLNHIPTSNGNPSM